MIVKLTTIIGVEIPKGANPEHVAAEMDNGLTYVLSSFPAGTIVGATVETAEPMQEAELRERGWTE